MMTLFEAIETRRSVRKYLEEPVPPSVIEKALDASLLAPNTSNLQPWEMYWVREKEKKAQLVTACLSQSSAQTAAELIVFVARTDTWRRNRELVLQTLYARAKPAVDGVENKDGSPQGSPPKQQLDYYNKIVPLFYSHGWLGSVGLLKSLLFPMMGLFRPVPRGPFSKSALEATLSKTVALACQTFMLAITAQGYSSCPMEGFDEWRVKKILGLGSSARVVMVISVGKEDPAGIYGPRLRLDPSLFLFAV